MTLPRTYAGNQESHEPHGWNVAKQILVSTVQAELHSGRLKINRNLKEAPILERELQDFQVSITLSGNATFSTRVGAHERTVVCYDGDMRQLTQGGQ